MSRMPKEVRAALESTGRPWAVEQGSKHIKLKVNGKLVAVMSIGFRTGGDKPLTNILAAIRKAGQ